MKSKLPSMGTIFSLLALASCSPTRTIESTRFQGVSDQMSVPYSLPRGVISITVVKTEQKPPEIKFNPVQLVPDPTARYVATFKRNAFRGDDFDFTLTDGLLTTVSNKASDSTPAFVSALTSGISGILSGSRAAAAARGDTPSDPTGTFTFLVDPFDHRSDLGNGVTVSFKVFNRQSSTPRQHLSHFQSFAECPPGSVCFPLLTTVRAEVTATHNERLSKSEFAAFIPDPSSVAALDVNRFACVEANTSISFNKGILTGYEIEKPSEAVGCLTIPLDVISTVIAAPINAITGRTARINADKGLIAAQQQLLESQKQLIEAQAALAEASE